MPIFENLQKDKKYSSELFDRSFERILVSVFAFFQTIPIVLLQTKSSSHNFPSLSLNFNVKHQFLPTIFESNNTDYRIFFNLFLFEILLTPTKNFS